MPRLIVWLRPAYCGRSTCSIGRPSTGRMWMRGPATSVRREVRISSVFEFSSRQPRSWIASLPPGSSPATITARVWVARTVSASVA